VAAAPIDAAIGGRPELTVDGVKAATLGARSTKEAGGGI
jgi:hypothetical protein